MSEVEVMLPTLKDADPEVEKNGSAIRFAVHEHSAAAVVSSLLRVRCTAARRPLLSVGPTFAVIVGSTVLFQGDSTLSLSLSSPHHYVYGVRASNAFLEQFRCLRPA